jgi:hypothetical protein
MHSVAIECGLGRSGRIRRSARVEVQRWPGSNVSKMTGAGGGGKTIPLGYPEPISCDTSRWAFVCASRVLVAVRCKPLTALNRRVGKRAGAVRQLLQLALASIREGIRSTPQP